MIIIDRYIAWIKINEINIIINCVFSLRNLFWTFMSDESDEPAIDKSDIRVVFKI